MLLPNLSLLSTTGTPVGNSKHLNRFGPQSTRPLPRWYWWSVKEHRWRRFDNNKTEVMRNNTLEAMSEKGMDGGLTPNKQIKWPKLGSGILIVSWNVAQRRGTFRWQWKDKKGVLNTSADTFTIERLSQTEAAEIQANNFIYDHSGKVDVTDDLLRKHKHCIPFFREMIMRELQHAKTHVFLYHSFHNVSLIYDLGACLMRVAFPDKVTPANKEAVMLRTDRSSFNLRTPTSVVKNFWNWYGGTDVGKSNPPGQLYTWVGVSAVLNLFKSNPESTIVDDFQKGYNPGDSPDLNPVLDEMLERFGIAYLRDDLLQLTIEADTDVTSFFGNKTHYFERESSQQHWRPMTYPLYQSAMDAKFKSFMEHDNKKGPVKSTIDGWEVTLQRDGPGMQAYGSAKHKNDTTRELLTVTKNPGKYLQLGIPLNKVDSLAYAALPFGFADTDKTHALSKMDARTDLSDGGQARIIARPDLMWSDDNLHTVYQFSRAAAEKRSEYLLKMETLLMAHAAQSKGKLMRIRSQFAPPPITVRSHNVWYKNPTIDALVKSLTDKPKYDFACLQECTTTILQALEAALPKTHRIIYNRTCGGTVAYAAMIYRSKRFTMSGSPFYGCFKGTNNKKDAGRPVVGGVFYDKYVRRNVLVISLHAPHKDYILENNLNYFLAQTVGNSDTLFGDVHHFVLAGDYNRTDWLVGQVVNINHIHYALRSAQGYVDGTVVPTFNALGIDNILFVSPEWKYPLELTSFTADQNQYGSDHRAVTAVFRS